MAPRGASKYQHRSALQRDRISARMAASARHNSVAAIKRGINGNNIIGGMMASAA